MKMILLLLVLAVIVMPAAAIDPRSMEQLDVKIIQSGNIRPVGRATMVSLMLYIPQDGVESVNITPNDWEYATDSYGNRMVLLKWRYPSESMDYRVETVVRNRAKHIEKGYEIYGSSYLGETQQVVFTDDIRKAAYPYERSLRRAAELAIWVNQYMTYDLNVTGQKSSEWAYHNRRGVCVEYSNLLSAMLKINGIPARHAVGYAYASMEKKFQGHTWVEILTNRGWVAIDPTWLQAGYIDATHIRTASLPDPNLTETIGYVGTGTIEWRRNPEEFAILDYETRNITKISVSEESGFIKARISGECSLSKITVKSCVDEKGENMFSIPEPERFLWFCDYADVYWPYKARGSKYICPVTVFDISGSVDILNVSVSSKNERAYITGPDTAKTNETFTIVASGLIVSPNLTETSEHEWSLKLDKPGTYKFYTNGSTEEKTIQVFEEKEFDIYIDAPKNTTLGNFSISALVKNTGIARSAAVKIEFGSAQKEKNIFIEKEAAVNFTLVATEKGARKITASVYNGTMASYTATIDVYEKKTEIATVDMLARIISSIAGFFSDLMNLM